MYASLFSSPAPAAPCETILYDSVPIKQGSYLTCLTTFETYSLLAKLSSPLNSKTDIPGHPDKVKCPPLALRMMLPKTHRYNELLMHTR